MKVNRRDFLKGMAVAGTAAMLTDLTVFSENDGPVNERDRPYDQWRIDGAEWVMVIDLAACDGCVDLDIPRCTNACIVGHYTPDDHLYLKVFEVHENEYSNTVYFPRPCQQCEDPPCAHVCPVSAAWQRDGDRLTLIDHTRCIGCRLCQAACPYEVRHFHFEENPKGDDIPDDKFEAQMPFTLFRGKGVTAKCEFCGLQFIGQLPHCVSACHNGALYFGDKNENAVTNAFGTTEVFTDLLARREAFRWKEEEGTKPRVFYLPASSSGNHGHGGNA
ncbi:MAG: 4Fe-4S dicluster domain-containing protein [Candidatus Heimdallarchaeota archaeon]|nr:4Fe-4S dicluster domain-containing protein [Candidatus Heimdallarchaeota archaeon]